MDWSAFVGGASGAGITLLVLLGSLVLWDEYTRRKTRTEKPAKPSLDEILERHLEEYIVQHFSDLFPGWRIYSDNPHDSMDDQKLSGIRLRTNIAGEIDLLCIVDKNNFVVIELKRTRAPDRVIAQVDRYINWIKKHKATPDQDVRGIIIARTFSDFLTYSLSRREEIDIWAYHWHLSFENWLREEVPPDS